MKIRTLAFAIVAVLACAEKAGISVATVIAILRQQSCKRRRHKELFDPRDVAILGGDPSL